MDSPDGDSGDSESQRKGFFKVPCMRTAFLYGTGGGIAAGLASFLFTSRVKRSADISVGVFTAVTLCTFAYCRYQRAKMKHAQKRYLGLQGIETTQDV